MKNVLYGHFLGHTSFSLKDDLPTLELDKKYDDVTSVLYAYREPLVRAALDDMAQIGLLCPLGDTYVLKAPLGSFNQSVVISPYTASMVADAFNHFARQVNGVPYTANKLAITDTEVQVLAQIVFQLSEQIDDMAEQMMAEDDEPGLGGGDPYGFHT